MKEQGHKTIAQNRKARHDYLIEDTLDPQRLEQAVQVAAPDEFIQAPEARDDPLLD